MSNATRVATYRAKQLAKATAQAKRVEELSEALRRAVLALETIAKGKYVLDMPWEAEISQGIAAQTLGDIAALTQGKGEAK